VVLYVVFWHQDIGVCRRLYAKMWLH